MAKKSARKPAKKMSKLQMTSWILCTIAALHIGLVEFLNFNAIGMLPGVIATIVYALIGLSGLYSVYQMFTCKK